MFRNRFHLIAGLLSIALLLMSAASPLWSQTNNGAIAGSILDSSGGAVANAEVKATAVETRGVYTTVSTATGAYRFSDLVLGHYDVTVTAKGFKVSTLTGVEVQINSMRPRYIDCAHRFRSSGWIEGADPQPSARSSRNPVYSSHRRLKNSTTRLADISTPWLAWSRG